MHETAVLRAIAEAAGAGAPVCATAGAMHDADYGLRAPDTLVGFIEWESGLRTGFSISVTAAFVRTRMLPPCARQGALHCRHSAATACMVWGEPAVRLISVHVDMPCHAAMRTWHGMHGDVRLLGRGQRFRDATMGL